MSTRKSREEDKGMTVMRFQSRGLIRGTKWEKTWEWKNEKLGAS
jgi:hypothetical protein